MTIITSWLLNEVGEDLQHTIQGICSYPTHAHLLARNELGNELKVLRLIT